MKAERGEEATGEKYKAKRDYFMRLKERNHLHKIKMHGEAASAGVEAAVSYPEGLSWIIEGGYTNPQISNRDKQPSGGRRCYLELPQLKRSYCLTSKFQTTGWLFVGPTVDGDLKPMSLSILKILEPLRIMLNLLCLYSVNASTKPEWQRMCTASFTDYAHDWDLLLRKTEIPFQIWLFIDNAPRTLMEMYEINIVFMPANAKSILQPMHQRVISTFYLRNTFHKSIIAIESDSSDGSGQSQLKISGKDSPF